MRIDPEAVYLEITSGTLIYNFSSGAERIAPAVILHWKHGRKWCRRSFIASEHNGDTLGAILARVGEWIDAKGLDAALNEASGLAAAGVSAAEEPAGD